MDLKGKSLLVTGGTGSFGKKFVDLILRVAPDIDRLIRLIENVGIVEWGDPGHRQRFLENANFLFQSADTGGLEEYATLEQMFLPDLLPLVTDWIRGVTGLDG